MSWLSEWLRVTSMMSAMMPKTDSSKRALRTINGLLNKRKNRQTPNIMTRDEAIGSAVKERDARPAA
jgi:hypothetical protein